MGNDMLRLEAGWIVTVDPDNQILKDHSLVVHNGMIEAILPQAEAAARYSDALVEDHRHRIIMPGLVNAHTHLAMNLMRGFADDLPLMRWLNEHIWPTEAQHLSSAFVSDGTELALAECFLSGVTTVNDMYFFPDAVARACENVGMRAAIGLVILDFPSAWAATADEYISKGLALHDQLSDKPLLSTCLAPHAPYTVSRESLEKIALLSHELDLPVHMHVHETRAEVDDFIQQHHTRPLQRLQEIGLLTPQLLAVHLTQLTTDDIELLATHGVHALHCPESNLKLASGFCPIAELSAAGVNVALGTDGAASNNDLDMLGEMRCAALVAKALTGDATVIPANEVIRMATINGACALGLGNHVGSLEVGKSADLIAIEPDISMLPMYDVASTIAYATGRERVRDVWVAGQPTLRDRQLQTLDVDRLTHLAREWAANIAF